VVAVPNGVDHLAQPGRRVVGREDWIGVRRRPEIGTVVVLTAGAAPEAFDGTLGLKGPVQPYDEVRLRPPVGLLDLADEIAADVHEPAYRGQRQPPSLPQGAQFRPEQRLWGSLRSSARGRFATAATSCRPPRSIPASPPYATDDEGMVRSRKPVPPGSW
jgi:hypothetical protein